jgi:hypothetical protein
MAAGDYISGSVEGSSHVVIGKDVRYSFGDDGEVSDSSKLDEIYRLVWKISERVSVQRMWLIGLTVAVALMALMDFVSTALGR